MGNLYRNCAEGPRVMEKVGRWHIWLWHKGQSIRFACCSTWRARTSCVGISRAKADQEARDARQSLRIRQENHTNLCTDFDVHQKVQCERRLQDNLFRTVWNAVYNDGPHGFGRWYFEISQSSIVASKRKKYLVFRRHSGGVKYKRYQRIDVWGRHVRPNSRWNQTKMGKCRIATTVTKMTKLKTEIAFEHFDLKKEKVVLVNFVGKRSWGVAMLHELKLKNCRLAQKAIHAILAMPAKQSRRN